MEARADKVVWCSREPSREAFLLRNRRLVDGSAYCIAYCTRPYGGSAYTLRYAQKQGLRVWNIGEMADSRPSSGGGGMEWTLRPGNNCIPVYRNGSASGALMRLLTFRLFYMSRAGRLILPVGP